MVGNRMRRPSVRLEPRFQRRSMKRQLRPRRRRHLSLLCVMPRLWSPSHFLSLWKTPSGRT